MFKSIVEVSARHIHLCREHLDQLFGKNYQLKNIKDLSQPGMFAAEETLVVQTAGNKFDKVRIVGPLRSQTQVEISKSDAFYLGINPPVKESGDLVGSEKCKLIGPRASVDLTRGAIIAQRHLHLDLPTAKKYNLKNGELVCVKVGSKKRKTTFCQVVVRISANFKPAIHLDTDEGNAAGIKKEFKGIVLKGDEQKA